MSVSDDQKTSSCIWSGGSRSKNLTICFGEIRQQRRKAHAHSMKRVWRKAQKIFIELSDRKRVLENIKNSCSGVSKGFVSHFLKICSYLLLFTLIIPLFWWSFRQVQAKTARKISKWRGATATGCMKWKSRPHLLNTSALFGMQMKRVEFAINARFYCQVCVCLKKLIKISVKKASAVSFMYNF